MELKKTIHMISYHPSKCKVTTMLDFDLKSHMCDMEYVGRG
jgi:hypothetical protein